MRGLLARRNDRVLGVLSRTKCTTRITLHSRRSLIDVRDQGWDLGARSSGGSGRQSVGGRGRDEMSAKRGRTRAVEYIFIFQRRSRLRNLFSIHQMVD